MTPDLEAIDVLSRQFEDSINKQERYSAENQAIILSDNNPLIDRSEKILRMYEAELQKFPDDPDAVHSLARHLFRMGYMHYEALVPDYLPGASMLGRNDGMGKLMARHAQNTCHYMFRSFQTMPNVQAAGYLGEIFRFVKFYGTAIHWYSAAEKAGGDPEKINEAKALRLELQSDGKTSDPSLTHRTVFPKPDTPGLVLENQSSGSPGSSAISRSGNSSSGCASILAGLLMICLVLSAGCRLHTGGSVSPSERSPKSGEHSDASAQGVAAPPAWVQTLDTFMPLLGKSKAELVTANGTPEAVFEDDTLYGGQMPCVDLGYIPGRNQFGIPTHDLIYQFAPDMHPRTDGKEGDRFGRHPYEYTGVRFQEENTIVALSHVFSSSGQETSHPTALEAWKQLGQKGDSPQSLL